MRILREREKWVEKEQRMKGKGRERKEERETERELRFSRALWAAQRGEIIIK
jgi:hypothetical protein